MGRVEGRIVGLSRRPRPSTAAAAPFRLPPLSTVELPCGQPCTVGWARELLSDSVPFNFGGAQVGFELGHSHLEPFEASALLCQRAISSYFQSP